LNRSLCWGKCWGLRCWDERVCSCSCTTT